MCISGSRRFSGLPVYPIVYIGFGGPVTTKSAQKRARACHYAFAILCVQLFDMLNAESTSCYFFLDLAGAARI